MKVIVGDAMPARWVDLRPWLPALIVITGCLFAASLVRGSEWAWPLAATVVLCCVFYLVLSRPRKTCDEALPDPFESDAWRQSATPVTVPWRSAGDGDPFDLRIAEPNAPRAFFFYAEEGDDVTIAVQTAEGSPGLSIWLFGPEDLHHASAHALCGPNGHSWLSFSASSTGVHYVGVKLECRLRTPCHYKLSIDAPPRAKDTPRVPRGRGDFSDVPVWHPYHDAVRAVSVARAMTGYRSGDRWEFLPDTPISRLDFSKVFVASIQPDLRSAAYDLLADLGMDDPDSLLPPDWDSSLCTDDADQEEPCPPPKERRHLALITRADAITTVVRGLALWGPSALSEAPPEYRGILPVTEDPRFPFLRIAEYNGFLSGLVKFRTDWDPLASASRGEVAMIMARMMQTVTHPRVSMSTAKAGPSAGDADDVAVEAGQVEPVPRSERQSLDDDFQSFAEASLDKLMRDGLRAGPGELQWPAWSPPSPREGVVQNETAGTLGGFDADGIRSRIEEIRGRLKAKALEVEDHEATRDNGNGHHS